MPDHTSTTVAGGIHTVHHAAPPPPPVKTVKRGGLLLQIARKRGELICTVSTDAALERAFTEAAQAAQGSLPGVPNDLPESDSNTSWCVPHRISDPVLGPILFACHSSIHARTVHVLEPRSREQLVRFANEVRSFMDVFVRDWLKPLEITVTVDARVTAPPAGQQEEEF